MKKIIIINGPNLNLLGKREVEIYGNQSFDDYIEILQKKYKNYFSIDYFQSNIEGELINKLHEVGFSFDGVLLNAGAYTHTSIALRDAISAIDIKVLEIHISNIFSREDFRNYSLISSVCTGSISGLGLKSYSVGLEYFK